jgi:hypothetical protein
MMQIRAMRSERVMAASISQSAADVKLLKRSTVGRPERAPNQAPSSRRP